MLRSSLSPPGLARRGRLQLLFWLMDFLSMLLAANNGRATSGVAAEY